MKIEIVSYKYYLKNELIFHYMIKKTLLSSFPFIKHNIDRIVGSKTKDLKEKLRINDNIYLLAAINNQDKPIGMLWAYKIEFLGTQRMHISILIVSKRYQKKGLGSKLIKKIIQISKYDNIDHVELNVSEQNKAFDFYTNIGFNVELRKLIIKT